MAGQATSVFYTKSAKYQLAQDLDDKQDNESKNDQKEGKEFILPALPFQQKSVNKLSFNSTPDIIISSPVINLLTPPPDKFVRF